MSSARTASRKARPVVLADRALPVGTTVVVTDATGRRPAAAKVITAAAGGIVTVRFTETGFAAAGAARQVPTSWVRIPAAFEVVR